MMKNNLRCIFDLLIGFVGLITSIIIGFIVSIQYEVILAGALSFLFIVLGLTELPRKSKKPKRKIKK